MKPPPYLSARHWGKNPHPCLDGGSLIHPELLHIISQTPCPSHMGHMGALYVQEWPDMVQASLARMTEKETAALHQLRSNMSEWAADMPENMPGDSLSHC